MTRTIEILFDDSGRNYGRGANYTYTDDDAKTDVVFTVACQSCHGLFTPDDLDEDVLCPDCAEEVPRCHVCGTTEGRLTDCWPDVRVHVCITCENSRKHVELVRSEMMLYGTGL